MDRGREMLSEQHATEPRTRLLSQRSVALDLIPDRKDSRPHARLTFTMHSKTELTSDLIGESDGRRSSVQRSLPDLVPVTAREQQGQESTRIEHEEQQDRELRTSQTQTPETDHHAPAESSDELDHHATQRTKSQVGSREAARAYSLAWPPRFSSLSEDSEDRSRPCRHKRYPLASSMPFHAEEEESPALPPHTVVCRRCSQSVDTGTCLRCSRSVDTGHHDYGGTGVDTLDIRPTGVKRGGGHSHTAICRQCSQSVDTGSCLRCSRSVDTGRLDRGGSGVDSLHSLSTSTIKPTFQSAHSYTRICRKCSQSVDTGTCLRCSRSVDTGTYHHGGTEADAVDSRSTEIFRPQNQHESARAAPLQSVHSHAGLCRQCSQSVDTGRCLRCSCSVDTGSHDGEGSGVDKGGNQATGALKSPAQAGPYRHRMQSVDAGTYRHRMQSVDAGPCLQCSHCVDTGIQSRGNLVKNILDNVSSSESWLRKHQTYVPHRVASDPSGKRVTQVPSSLSLGSGQSSFRDPFDKSVDPPSTESFLKDPFEQYPARRMKTDPKPAKSVQDTFIL